MLIVGVQQEEQWNKRNQYIAHKDLGSLVAQKALNLYLEEKSNFDYLKTGEYGVNLCKVGVKVSGIGQTCQIAFNSELRDTPVVSRPFGTKQIRTFDLPVVKAVPSVREALT